MRFADMRELQTAADMAGLEMEFLELRESVQALRKDAERYRVIRQDHESKVLPDLALYAGRALDEYIDAAIDRMRGIGAA